MSKELYQVGAIQLLDQTARALGWLVLKEEFLIRLSDSFQNPQVREVISGWAEHTRETRQIILGGLEPVLPLLGQRLRQFSKNGKL